MDDQGNSMNWTKISRQMVNKIEYNKIFYVSSYLQKDYMSVRMKQRQPIILIYNIQKLYSQPHKIAKDKHEDLKSLCECNNVSSQILYSFGVFLVVKDSKLIYFILKC